MRNNWLVFMDLDRESQHMFPLVPLLSQGCKDHLFVDNSLHQSRFLYIPGSMAFQEALNRMSKLAGGVVFWFTSVSSSNLRRQMSGNQPTPKFGSLKSSSLFRNFTFTGHDLSGLGFGSMSSGESSPPVVFGKISSFVMRLLRREAGRLQSFPVFSLAAALVPPFDNL